MVVDAALKKADQVRRERNGFIAIKGEVPFLNHFPEDTFDLLEVVRRYNPCARSNRFTHSPNPSQPRGEQGRRLPRIEYAPLLGDYTWREIQTVFGLESSQTVRSPRWVASTIHQRLCI